MQEVMKRAECYIKGEENNAKKEVGIQGKSLRTGDHQK
ncbi:hypothetical protein A2U01_0066867, partial [Trifolium medium]|nr:hypothetical protein [Trifolium medium]